MSATDVDFIGPKNAAFVTISGATCIPQVSSLSVVVSGGAAALTLTGTAYSFGKINVIQLHSMSAFTGNAGATLTFSIAGAGVPLPAQPVYYPSINTLDGVTEVGYITIAANGDSIIAAVPAGTGFTTKEATVYSMVVHYASA